MMSIMNTFRLQILGWPDFILTLILMYPLVLWELLGNIFITYFIAVVIILFRQPFLLKECILSLYTPVILTHWMPFAATWPQSMHLRANLLKSQMSSPSVSCFWSRSPDVVPLTKLNITWMTILLIG